MSSEEEKELQRLMKVHSWLKQEHERLLQEEAILQKKIQKLVREINTHKQAVKNIKQKLR